VERPRFRLLYLKKGIRMLEQPRDNPGVVCEAREALVAVGFVGVLSLFHMGGPSCGHVNRNDAAGSAFVYGLCFDRIRFDPARVFPASRARNMRHPLCSPVR
jgi:hypothetical protein